jgi:hypothetical protein
MKQIDSIGQLPDRVRSLSDALKTPLQTLTEC